MRRRALLLGLLATPASAQDLAQTVAAVFRERLQPFGQWREIAGLGPVWRPDNLPDGWRPFSKGRWRYTFEAGWFWEGMMPFSDIAEHRGRWRLLDGGWSWVPGTRFDPAPVAWARPGPGLVAWAPLPTGEQAVQGWSSASIEALLDEQVEPDAASLDPGYRRTAPPDPSEVSSAAGRDVEPVSLGDLVDADDLTAWYAVDTRSVFGIRNPRVRLPRPGATPSVTGPNSADDAWRSFDRQHQYDLQDNERLRAEERRRDSNDLR